MSAVIDETLLPAWDDSVHASQAAFRCVLDALSEPGVLRTLPVTIAGPQPLNEVLTALCLALFDPETPVWCDATASTPAVASYLRFHCGCPLTSDPACAAFAVIADSSDITLGQFAQGSMEYPDRSTTLLIQVPSLVDGPVRTLSGPGIQQTEMLRVAGLPQHFNAGWNASATRFPLGVDLVFCCGNQIVGLPRTTQIHG